jgi:NNP family nitrate/nitrite transporter-like MFS transporter
MIWVLLGGLGNCIGDSFHLSGTQKGLITSVPVLNGAALRLLLGPLGERFGGRRTGLVCLTLTTLPLLAGWLFAGSFSGVLLGMAGSSFAVALPLASRWYSPDSGRYGRREAR